MLARLVACALLATLLLGCQTARSIEQGCPAIYSGVKYYTDQYPELPVGGKIFFTLDLPLTAVFDTLAIPYTAFADQKMPKGGYPHGCRWAQKP